MTQSEIQIGGVRFEKEYWECVQPQLARLTGAGLVVSGPRERRMAHEISFMVWKPAITPGHTVPSTDAWCGFADQPKRDTEGPSVTLETDNGRWVVIQWRYIPGPGLGDFSHKYDRLDEAIGDILDFYFGDPTRMHSIWRSKRLG